jgi:hypothetical protein
LGVPRFTGFLNIILYGRLIVPDFHAVRLLCASSKALFFLAVEVLPSLPSPIKYFTSAALGSFLTQGGCGIPSFPITGLAVTVVLVVPAVLAAGLWILEDGAAGLDEHPTIVNTNKNTHEKI